MRSKDQFSRNRDLFAFSYGLALAQAGDSWQLLVGWMQWCFTVLNNSVRFLKLKSVMVETAYLLEKTGGTQLRAPRLHRAK
jgi:hypothetical protein